MEKNFFITEINDSNKKSCYTREILEKLPKWFGNKQALDDYVEKVKSFPYWAALDTEKNCIGFFSVKIHYSHTGEIFVCGVIPEYHRNGIGKAIYKEIEKFFLKNGCKYVIVKTLSETAVYEPYDLTRKFYKDIGFESLITLTEMWDEDNPCLIMFKSLM